jgi:septal ring factor EnvC (AmiA/AmiB activator)
MSWVGVASVAAALLTGGGFVAIVNAVSRRRLVRVEVADRLNEATLEWAEAMRAENAEIRRDNTETRQELAEARREAAEVRREMTVVRHEAEALAHDLRRIREAILDPDATLERLRALVGNQSANGTE